MKGSGWKIKFAINTVGAIVTSVVAVIFAVTKFTSGAWVVLIIIPLIISFSLAIHHHYQNIADELKIDLIPLNPKQTGLSRSLLFLGYIGLFITHYLFALGISQADLIAVIIGFDDESIKRMETKWGEMGETL